MSFVQYVAAKGGVLESQMKFGIDCAVGGVSWGGGRRVPQGVAAWEGRCSTLTQNSCSSSCYSNNNISSSSSNNSSMSAFLSLSILLY